MTNSLSICSEVVFLSFLKDNFVRYNILGWQLLLFFFFSFRHFEFIISLAPGLQGFAEKSFHSLMGIPLYVISHFYLAAFKTISFSLTFNILIIMYFEVIYFGLILLAVMSFPYLDVHISLRFRTFSTIISLNNLVALFSLFSFLDSQDGNVHLLNGVP